MSKPTPGPWKPDRGLILYENQMIAGVALSIDGNAERYANARLMAAAPDLLEALEKLNSAIDDFWNAPREDRMPLVGDDCLVRAITDAQQAAFTAIQKAKGEQDG